MPNVLLIEDNPGDARLIREMIAEDEAPFTVHCADRLALGLEHLSNGETALVLLDLSLPDSFGLETFAKVYAHAPTVPIIVLTGNDDATVALSAVKGGAQDYLVKGGISASRIETVGYGESQPVATNDTADGRAQNRRTELKVKGQ